MIGISGTRRGGQAPECPFSISLRLPDRGQRGEFSDVAHRQSTCNPIGHMELYSRGFVGMSYI
jgi:hypothetical protein